MTDELTTKAAARELDGFETFEDGVEGSDQQTTNRRVIQGSLIKFTNETTWVTRDGEELPNELELLAVDIGRVVQNWVDPVKTIVLEPGKKFPDVEKMNAKVPQAEWTEGPDGKKRGPWQAQHVVYLMNVATMDRFSYPTGTVGGAIAVADLVDRTKFMRRFRGLDIYPVVRLSDVFMPTRWKGRQRPHFEIVRWVKLDGGNALPLTETPALTGPAPLDPAPAATAPAATPAAAATTVPEPPPASTKAALDKFAAAKSQGETAKTVEPPSAKEATQDEIRW
jgi:hypothetical protein